MYVIIDNLLHISTKKLREWQYFNVDSQKTGIISWSSNDVKSASIRIIVDMIKETTCLKYSFNGNPVNQEIPLEYLNSNIGNGKVWYFICPVALKRCSKLYLINGKFVSRSAIKNGIYSNQTKSKNWRKVDSFFSLSDKRTNLLDDLDTPYRKSHYKGKWTKKSNKLIKLSQKLEQIGPLVLNGLA